LIQGIGVNPLISIILPDGTEEADVTVEFLGLDNPLEETRVAIKKVNPLHPDENPITTGAEGPEMDPVTGISPKEAIPADQGYYQHRNPEWTEDQAEKESEIITGTEIVDEPPPPEADLEEEVEGESYSERLEREERNKALTIRHQRQVEDWNAREQQKKKTENTSPKSKARDDDNTPDRPENTPHEAAFTKKGKE